MSPRRGSTSLKTSRRARALGLVAVAGVVLAVDQVTKTLAVDRLSSGPRHLIGPFSLQLAFNSGVAFSLGTGLGAPIIIVAVVLLASILWFARSLPSRTGVVAVGLVLGGALGNLTDRLFRSNHGAVIDFVHTSFWPTFNLADASIVIGCLLLAVLFWRHGVDGTRNRVGRRQRSTK